MQFVIFKRKKENAPQLEKQLTFPNLLKDRLHMIAGNEFVGVKLSSRKLKWQESRSSLIMHIHKRQPELPWKTTVWLCFCTQPGNTLVLGSLDPLLYNVVEKDADFSLRFNPHVDWIFSIGLMTAQEVSICQDAFSSHHGASVNFKALANKKQKGIWLFIFKRALGIYY